MKNITNAYLVLSVANIREMLRAAELEQQVRGEPNRDNIFIVLEKITVGDIGKKNCEPQIASWSVNDAVAKCAAESAKDLADNGSWTAPKTTCMNHSDAAI